METVKIPPKFQVVIPQKVRNHLNLTPGQRVQVIQYYNRIELIPERDISSMKGFLKGINPDFIREENRL